MQMDDGGVDGRVAMLVSIRLLFFFFLRVAAGRRRRGDAAGRGRGDGLLTLDHFLNRRDNDNAEEER